MLVRVLGSVELWDRDHVFPVGPAQRCAVFAALIADARRIVPVATLIERVWGEEPPPGARRTLHTHLTRIRRLMERANFPTQLSHRAGGYLLDLEPDRVDIHRFASLTEQARTCADNRRAALLREALELWRGEPLAGVPGQWAEQVRWAWLQRHLDAVLTWAQTTLRLGDPGGVIGALTELAGQYPLDESVVATLMRALTAAGRTADALDRYLDTRQRLADDLGVDPGPELRELYQSVLRGTVCRPTPAADQNPRTFYLARSTSRVADGVLWPDGSASLRWHGEHRSAVHWDQFEDTAATQLYGTATRIIWLD
jgi:DNA-binding SARP family transcriptional activator